MNDYLVERSAEQPIDATTPELPRWWSSRGMLPVELALTWCAVGWTVVGLYTGLGHRISPAGNAFNAAATFTGSWRVLTTLTLITALLTISGLLLQRRGLRRAGMGFSAFCWGFIAAGLSTTGFVSTAVVVYPSLSVLALVTYLKIPDGRR